MSPYEIVIVTHRGAFTGEVIAEHQAGDSLDTSGVGVITRSLALLTREEIDLLRSRADIQSVVPAQAGTLFADDTEGAVRVISQVTWEMVADDAL